MVPRQFFLFRFGCWATIVTGVVHLGGHLSGQQPPANETERQLMALATSYRFTLPGGAERSIVNFLDGFSLMFALLLVTLGGVGLIVARRGHDDRLLMAAVARAFTVSAAALLVISLTNFFIVPSLFIAVMVVCFFSSAIQAPTE